MLCGNYSTASPSVELSNALSCSIRSRGKAEPVATVKPPQSVSAPNWHTSDEPKPVCTMKIALKCTLYVKTAFLFTKSNFNLDFVFSTKLTVVLPLSFSTQSPTIPKRTFRPLKRGVATWSV